ncbi:MAG: hypothetical protein GWN71_12080, partial [Gammaproteobacteria bacterium]|nr:hypothetical protein [Gemmatimonadota bacterium]NIU74290.1 hypothetical protein [Gammaproteobacteria bacterium]NIV88553.1 hypothetical protein [Actinomycetota bacterium]
MTVLRSPAPTRLASRIAVLALLLSSPAAGPVQGQTADTVLTLGDARTLLRRNSPEYRAQLAAANAAGEDVWR